MRLLLLTQYFPPEIGAAQQRLAAIVKELVQLGHQVEIVTAMPNHPTGSIFPEYRGRLYLFETWQGIPVHRCWVYPSTGAGLRRVLNFSSFAVTSLIGLVRAKKPDYIFVEYPPLFLGISAYLGAVVLRSPVIVNVSDLWLDAAVALGFLRGRALISVMKSIERWIYCQARCVNVVTEGLRDTLIHKKGVSEHKVLFLPNGVNTELFKAEPVDLEFARRLGLEGKRIALYAGTHGYVHAVEQILYAAKALTSQPDIHFVLVGDGSEKQRLRRLSSRLGLRNLSFFDPVPIEDMPKFLSIASVGIVTQRGLPLFESVRSAKMFPIMASAKPVVLSGVGEGARIVEEAKAGIVVPPETPKALAEAIHTLAYNTDLSKKMGQNGRRYVKKHFTWSLLVQEWLAQLENTFPNKSRKSSSLTSEVKA